MMNRNQMGEKKEDNNFRFILLLLLSKISHLSL
jgi:hypothetical protein